MKKTISFEVDDELYDVYLKPKIEKRKLSKLVSEFFTLYGKSREVRQYFEDLDARNAQKKLRALENIINDKDFLKRVGLLDAEIDDIEVDARNAKRTTSASQATFSFDEDDEEVEVADTQGYATKADIVRIEETMNQILSALSTGNVNVKPAKVNVVQQPSTIEGETYLTAEGDGEGEDAGDALEKLDMMFSFDD